MIEKGEVVPLAKVKDAQIHYQWNGPEQAPVLLFSNSLGTTWRMWDPQVSDFSKSFRLLRYDIRGSGDSTITAGPNSIAQLSWDVVRLLDVLSLDQVHFCGLSMGGMTGMFLGANAPKRFHKIVLCNTAAKFGTPATWNGRINAVREGGMKAVASSVIERWLTPGFRAAHPADTTAAQAMLESANPDGYVANCAAVRDADLRATLGDVQVPALVLAGLHDPVATPADGRFLADRIPGAGYAEVSAAHLSNLEAQAEFNRKVLDFLTA
jgi:3-oxoadipate enol-lactonase